MEAAAESPAAASRISFPSVVLFSVDVLLNLLYKQARRFYLRGDVFLGGVVGAVIVGLLSQSLQAGVVPALVDGKESLSDVMLTECADGSTMGAYTVAVVNEQGRYSMEQRIVDSGS